MLVAINLNGLDKLKISIDCDECIGDGACEAEAPETFFMDDDSIACGLTRTPCSPCKVFLFTFVVGTFGPALP